MDTMFGDAIGGWKLVLAGFVVIVLMAVFFWGLRRFGGDRLNNSAARGRQPRLAVIDAATVDGRRRLVLIRRDNVEHLLIIGGPTDVVVEQNIVRSTPAAREGAPARPAAATDALPRAVPLGEGTMWPLQPEPAPAPRLEPAPRPEPPTPRVDATQRLDPTPRLEPTSRLEPAARLEPAPRPEPRPQRAPPVAEQRSPIAAEQRLPSISEQRAPPVMEEQIEWSAEAEQAAPPPPPPGPRERRPRTVDPLAGLAEELSRVPPQSEPSDHEPPPPPRQMEPPPPLRPMEPPPRREPPARREPRAPRPQPAPPAPPV
jgi:flagellar protein FliO/FliZ